MWGLLMGSLYLTKYSTPEIRGDNHIHVRKFGSNISVGTTEGVISTDGGTYPGFLTAADTVRVASGGDSADTLAGASARKVVVSGLDANWRLASEEIELAGASASASTTTEFIRINRAYVSEVGTYGGTCAGDINIETAGGISLAVIPATISQTEMCIYTIPAGYVGFVTRITASSETNKPVNIFGHARLDADNTVAELRADRTVFKRLAITAEFSQEFTTPDRLLEKTDIWVTGEKTSAGTSIVYAELDINLVRIE